MAAEGPYAVILAPTRELAQQIEVEAKKMAVFTAYRFVSVVGGAPRTLWTYSPKLDHCSCRRRGRLALGLLTPVMLSAEFPIPLPPHRCWNCAPNPVDLLKPQVRPLVPVSIVGGLPWAC